MMAQRRNPSAADRQTLPGAVAGVWIVACLVLGGASNAGIVGNALLQLTAVGLIGWMIFSGPDESGAGYDRQLRVMLAALVGWVLFTLVPLPPGVWTALPGRGFLIDGYQLLDMPLPWLSLSLTDERTVRSALALLVPVAAYLLFRRAGHSAGQWTIRAIAVIAALSVLMGMAQLLGGEDSPLRPYAITNRRDPVGLFANANHFATFLLAAIPLVLALSDQPAAAPKPRRGTRNFAAYAAWGLVAICALGLVLIGSNAGLLLLVPALAGGWLARHLGGAGTLHDRRLVIGAGGLALAAVLGLGLTVSSGALADKLGTSATSRTQVTATTLTAARDFLPTGSGLGSFAQTYLAESGGQGTTREWMNHAHNDLAEVLLELGLPGALLVAAFLLWFLRAGWRLWQVDRSGRTARLARASWVAAGLMLAHSLVDYPLRTAAIAALFGMALALIVAGLRDPDGADSAR